MSDWRWVRTIAPAAPAVLAGLALRWAGDWLLDRSARYLDDKGAL